MGSVSRRRLADAMPTHVTRASSASASVAPSKRPTKGLQGAVRDKPRSDRFATQEFHHVEFYCGDALTCSKRYGWGLGLNAVAKSDQSTGNAHYASYVMRSKDVRFVCTAPYSSKVDLEGSRRPLPNFDQEAARQFFNTHGLGVRALGIRVEDAHEAFEQSVRNGAVPVMEPIQLQDEMGDMTVAEVELYGDVVLRYVSGDFQGEYLPGYTHTDVKKPHTWGPSRVDHAVGNVYNLAQTVDYITKFTGFHEFAEFTAKDVGTENSGLNSIVLANNDEKILLPVNEPTYGTRRKSQIQMFLEQNEGPGLQHIALMTEDIFQTLREMRERSDMGGFEFMPSPPPTYYERMPDRLGDSLTPEQYKACEELGILGDKDDQGVLLQIFTRPLGDRPTFFIEIIQRIGCMEDGVQKGGCGGFGKGNFSELFRSIEIYEEQLKV